MTAIVILLTILTILSLFQYRRKSSIAAAKLPPHPPGLPILGNLHQLGSLPHRSLYSLSKKYGPLMLLHYGGSSPTVVVSSAEIAEQVMKVQDLNFASRPPSTIANRLLYNSVDVAFSPYNDYWRQVKKICMVHLLSSKRVRSFRRVRTEEIALLIADIRASATSSSSSATAASPASPAASPAPSSSSSPSSSPPSSPPSSSSSPPSSSPPSSSSSPPSSSTVNLSKKLVTLTNDITSRVALGAKFSGEKRLTEMLHELMSLLGAFSAADFVPLIGGWIDVLTGLDARMRRLSAGLDEFLEQVLEMHRTTAKATKTIDGVDDDGVDFVDVLLSLRDGDGGGDAAILQKDHIKAIVLDMFAAGTETTYTVLEWAMAELIKNPTVMHKVQREIRDAIGSKGVVEEGDINKLTFLKAVVKEALRLHVPVALLVPRVAADDTTLQGYHIPAGTRIMINAWAIARDPNYWDRPEEFFPDRFINSNVDFRGKHFQFTPFGAGRRVCPGIGFAITAIEGTLANLLYHFDWEVPQELKDEVFDMSESPGITVHKKSTLVLTAKLHFA